MYSLVACFCPRTRSIKSSHRSTSSPIVFAFACSSCRISLFLRSSASSTVLKQTLRFFPSSAITRRYLLGASQYGPSTRTGLHFSVSCFAANLCFFCHFDQLAHRSTDILIARSHIVRPDPCILLLRGCCGRFCCPADHKSTIAVDLASAVKTIDTHQIALPWLGQSNSVSTNAVDDPSTALDGASAHKAENHTIVRLK
jgi:hypothetical protein